MKTFLKKWNGRSIEDDGCVMSKEAKSFVTAFRNMLKRELGDDYTVDIHAGHYDLSGFIEHDSMYEYVSYSIPRYGYAVNADDHSAMLGCLFRCAKGPKDYTGGHNNFCSIRQLPDSIRSAFETQKRFGFI